MRVFRTSPDSATSEFPEINTPSECDELVGRAGLTILFKHSHSCGTSWMAHREMVRLQALRPDAPITLISVSNSRALSRYIAERFAVEHESPQVLVIRNNELLAARSHDDITVNFLLPFVDGVA